MEDIHDFKLYDAKNVMNIDSVTKHQLVTKNPQTGQERLFLSVQRLVDNRTNE